ncbi:MAG: alpha/beta fold hydrolase [Planctomycetota bacterium]
MNRTVSYTTEIAPDRIIRGTVELPPEDTLPAPVVVFCHGFKGFKDWGGWPWLSRRLAARGFIVNRFNFSYCGVAHSDDLHDEPAKFSQNTYGLEIDDLRALLARRQEWGINDVPCRGTVGLLGHSRGGLVSLLYAPDDLTIGAVATLGAPGRSDRFDDEQVAEWRRVGKMEIPNARTGQLLHLDRSVLEDYESNRERYNVAAAIDRRAVPTMVIHAADDATVGIDEAHLIYNRVQAPRRLEVFPEGGHTFGTKHPFDGTSEELEQVVDHAADWFAEHL